MNDATAAVDAIRRTELDAARRIEAAKEDAERMVADARIRVRRLEDEGEERGRARAEERIERERADALREADRIVSRGVEAAASLKEEADGMVAELVAALVDAVLAPPSDQEE